MNGKYQQNFNRFYFPVNCKERIHVCDISELNICERLSTWGLVISNTSWWGEDATQVYSTEEVCRRVGN